MQSPDEQTLLRQFVDQHSEEAFAALVARHVNLVYSVALRQLGSPHNAQEVTQAVFIVLAKKAPQLRHARALSSWLFQTTRLTANNFIRSEMRRRHREEEAHMQSVLDPSGNDIWPQIAPLLDDAVARLSESDRQAIVLRFYQGRNVREVGAALGTTEDAAEKRLSRALDKLRAFFARHGVVSTNTLLAEAISAGSVQAAPPVLAKTITALALAKGAAASASALTFSQGALKIMAWTKTKTTALAAVIVLTLAPVTALLLLPHHGPHNQTGRLRLPAGNVTPMIGYGYSRFIVILAPNGSLWSWGEEALGWPILGLAKTNIENTVSLRRIGDATDWASIAVGSTECLAIKKDGSLWGWGANYSYQLGDGTEITRPTPVPSIPGNDWKQAATEANGSLAVKNDGTLWGWGGNYAGQLGLGKLASTTTAKQIGTATNWAKVWTGPIQTVGLQTDGSLWFWGSYNGEGKGTNNALEPTRVSPDTNWTEACFGYYTVFALKADGTLWTWGRDAYIYAGGDPSEIRVPAQIGTDEDWQSISSAPACFYLLLRKRDGSLWTLDASEHRTIKPDSQYKPLAFRKTPYQGPIAAYAAGGDDIGIVLTPAGDVWTWGRVLGQHARKDFEGPRHQRLMPKYETEEKPWRVTNID